LQKMKANLERKKRELEEASASKSDKSSTVVNLEKEVNDLKHSISTKPDMKNLVGQLSVARTAYEKKQFGLDLCFVMDCTGSMASWIEQAKDKVNAIMEASLKIDKRVFPRVAFIGYRDYGDLPKDRYFLIDFTEGGHMNEFQDSLATCTATKSGNTDTAEDVAGGLDKAIHMSWLASTRILVHIADAPCHGTKYNNCGDSYPKGDPEGKVPEDLLIKLCKMEVDYYFCRINATTDKMTSIFEQTYKSKNRSFTINDIGEDPQKFLPMVIASIRESMSKSKAFEK